MSKCPCRCLCCKPIKTLDTTPSHNMAEANKSGIFAKAHKRIARTKTKVLQNFGKADKSRDEIFDELVQKTEKQQETAHHLQKEIKTYLHCIKALSHASKSLSAAICQTYEEEWTEEPTFNSSLESIDLLWEDYMKNVHDQVVEPLNNYIASFPVLKARIAKRGRKMVDYDNSRHNLDSLQQAKKKDEAKITKAQEELNESKKIYENLHSELCSDLPEFYNGRVTFYADIFQKFFGREYILHSEISKASDDLTRISEKLGRDFQQFVYKPKRPLSKSLSDNSDEPVTNGQPSPKVQVHATRTPAAPVSRVDSENHSKDVAEAEDHLYLNQEEVEEARSKQSTATRISGVPDRENETRKSETKRASDSSKLSDEGGAFANNIYEDPKGDDNLSDSDHKSDAEYSSPTGKPVHEPPPNFLYMVIATHAYKGEDIDELYFESGDIVYVVPFDSDDEQDEGWQMGIKQKDGVKGVFPENFTRRL